MSDKKKIKINFSGLTKNWLMKTALVTVAILLVICVVCALLIRNYYYDSVENKLKSYSSLLSMIFQIKQLLKYG